MNPQTESADPMEMCICGHEREAHFEHGCACEAERDVTCACTAFASRLPATPNPERKCRAPECGCAEEEFCEANPASMPVNYHSEVTGPDGPSCPVCGAMLSCLSCRWPQSGEAAQCPRCKGSGEIERQELSPNGHPMWVTDACPVCC